MRAANKGKARFDANPWAAAPPKSNHNELCMRDVVHMLDWKKSLARDMHVTQAAFANDTHLV